jgi:MoxR-like ATPase
MNIDKVERLIRHMWRLCQEQRFYYPLCLWGEAGVGKSDVVKGVADQLNEEFARQNQISVQDIPADERVHTQILMLGQLDVGDLIGTPRSQKVYPDPYEARNSKGFSKQYTKVELVSRYAVLKDNTLEDGTPEFPELQGLELQRLWDDGLEKLIEDEYPHLMSVETAYSVPPWFPTRWSRKKGILFLDEINRGTKDVRNACFQLLLDRTLHNRTLPEDWIILSAANPNIGGEGRSYQDVEEMDDVAWKNRFIHIGFEPEPSEWMRWAMKTQKKQDPNNPSKRIDRIEGTRPISNVNPQICNYIVNSTGALGVLHVDTPQDIVPTPRGWVTFSRVVDGMPEDLIEQVGMGLIGTSFESPYKSMVDRPEFPVGGAEVLDQYLLEEIKTASVSQEGKKARELFQEKGSLSPSDFKEIVSIRQPNRSEYGDRIWIYTLEGRDRLLEETAQNVFQEISRRLMLSPSSPDAAFTPMRCDNLAQFLVDIAVGNPTEASRILEGWMRFRNPDGTHPSAMLKGLFDRIKEDPLLFQVKEKVLKRTPELAPSSGVSLSIPSKSRKKAKK